MYGFIYYDLCDKSLKDINWILIIAIAVIVLLAVIITILICRHIWKDDDIEKTYANICAKYFDIISKTKNNANKDDIKKLIIDLAELIKER